MNTDSDAGALPFSLHLCPSVFHQPQMTRTNTDSDAGAIQFSLHLCPSVFICGSYAHDRVRPREPAAEGDEDQDVALLHLARAPRLVERDRDGGSRRVAVAVDVDVCLLRPH